MSEKVFASPSKNFFVTMMTRDIALKDAILDLLDNCVDGLLRDLRDKDSKPQSEKPYEGYWARIEASSTGFSIEDNCGGIPKDVAINSAFMLGRPDLKRDEDLPTVGMYGIGMKRALFKMGKHSIVGSQHQNDAFSVEITEEWLGQDSNWELSLEPEEAKKAYNGTFIIVNKLYDNISRDFDKNSTNFLTDLRSEISNLFAIIIKKGFSVFLNEKEIEPADLDILFSRDFDSTTSVKPYAYKGSLKGVSIEVVVGFYAKLATEDELDDEKKLARRSDKAGWTVICNDRVVLHRDKSAMTGWGVRDVPKYHTQFIAIAGIVRFFSTDSYKLPLNTTKRGLDTSSEVYTKTLNIMMDGLKEFTDFTNRWKGRETETNEEFRKLTLTDATQVIEAIPNNVWRSIRTSDKDRSQDSEVDRRFKPTLPKPPQNDIKRRISFFRVREEIEKVAFYLFADSTTQPSQVGEECFQRILKNAEAEEEENE
jgi:hypothetical protein